MLKIQKDKILEASKVIPDLTGDNMRLYAAQQYAYAKLIHHIDYVLNISVLATHKINDEKKEPESDGFFDEFGEFLNENLEETEKSFKK